MDSVQESVDSPLPKVGPSFGDVAVGEVEVRSLDVPEAGVKKGFLFRTKFIGWNAQCL